MVQDESKICQVCGKEYPENRVEHTESRLLRYSCERCGCYYISIDSQLMYKENPPWLEIRHLLSAWIKRQNNIGVTPTIDDVIKASDWGRFKHMGFPETTTDKLDALLLAYVEGAKGDYLERIPSDQLVFITKVAAKNIKEIQGLARLLEEMGYLGKDEKAYGGRLISAKGWLRVEELRSIASSSNSAFVAMWFDDITKEYRNAVIVALEYCGYEPVIVDQEEYNGFIMDQVTTLIKQARFIIADFTSRPEIEIEGHMKIKNGVRGGVYWEAGMAYGLGKPVIHTCEENAVAKARIHFDVDQYNTIFWKSDELNTEIRSLDITRGNPTFTERPAARILATVGRGIHVPEKKLSL